MFVAALVALCGLAADARAQPQDRAPGTNPHWIESETRIASVPARMSFPRIAGSLSFTGTRALSADGEEIDSTAQYRSADRQIVGTVYVYLPGLAHPGLASFATQQAIRVGSSSPVRLVRSRTVSAGRLENMAIRDDYENYRDGNSSSAAFLKAGRWQIKIRVTGPESRRREVDSAMDALLAGIEFGRQNPAQDPSPLTVTDCAPEQTQRDAHLLPDPPAEQLAAHAFLGTFDGGGMIATDENGARRDLPSRVPRELCLSGGVHVGAQSGGQTIPVLRAAAGPGLAIEGRTLLVAILSDSGTWIEVVHARNLDRYLMLFHQIGSTRLLGAYDGVPSDRQIAELLAGTQSEAARIRAVIRLTPDGRTEIELLPAPQTAPSAPVT
jgi:hypothetical protein